MVKVALEPDPRFDRNPPVIRSQSEMDGQFKAIEKHRQDMDLPVYAHGDGRSRHCRPAPASPEKRSMAPTAASIPRISRCRWERAGSCSSASPESFGLKVENLGQAKFLSHAEAEALIRAYTRFGALPEVVELSSIVPPARAAIRT